MLTRPTWIVFDLNGTLVDPAGLLPDEDPALANAALDDAVLMAMADTLSGGFIPLADHLRAALERRLLQAGLDPVLANDAMTRAKALPAMPGAAEALARLADAGYRIAIVSNNPRDTSLALLENAGLDTHVDVVVGADEVRAYKPDARVYHYAEQQVGSAGDALCLLAAHAWDILGAHRVGWGTAWVAHREKTLLSTAPERTLHGRDLADIAQALAAL